MMREPQEMVDESITESESESESECWVESSSGSDWSESKGKQSQQGNKRKMKTQSCKETEQMGPTSLHKREDTSKHCQNSSWSLGQKINKHSLIPVTCENKEGSLYLEKYEKGEKCILSEGQWFKPTDFEKFGGKEKSKKWKTSILCLGVPLQKLIEDKLLPSSNFKKSRIKNEQSKAPKSPPVAVRLRGAKRNFTKRDPDRLRITKSTKIQLSSSSEGREDDEDSENSNDDGKIYHTLTIPVTCGSLSGILHKNRFAKGHSGKCIRTEDSWLTPEDFIRLSKQDGIWRKDIVSHEIPLGKLIMINVLQLHTINCDCNVCEELDQSNDDVCYVCDSEEDLVCCDECPRAFHPDCHLPAVHDNSPGDQWSCTFCVMKKIEVSNHQTRQDVLNSPLSQYKLHCQYLLLYLLHESNADACTKVSGTKNINGSHDVKLNLQNDSYQTVGQFVTDIEHIFQDCTTIGDNDLNRIDHLYKKEFETIFKLV